MKKDLLRKLPSVDSILKDREIAGFSGKHPRRLVIDAIRLVLKGERDKITSRKTVGYEFSMADFADKLKAEIDRIGRPSLVKVVNATGVVLHTNLGREPLAEAALESLIRASLGYSNLEYDLEKGERGERYSHLEPLLCKLTGAEAAVVVNNNAAAVLLALNTLAEGKDVIVSRGELVEIGGSFRIPDVMKKSGARLVEVGTTNRTHLKDYERGITQETALILKVHQSNFEMAGFTSDVPMQEMTELGKRYGIPVMNDLGSGSLIDLSKYGMKKEPTVQDSVKSGIDVVTFSGDKLLGGPQAGIIVGRKDIIDAIKKNPLTRALRVDKLTVAALEATLMIYMDERRAVADIPVLRMLTLPLEDLTKTARKLLKRLKDVSGDMFEVKIKDGCSKVGGGALPLQEIPTKLLSIKPKDISPNELERRLRKNLVPIIVRIEKDEVLLDLRTLMDGDTDIITDFFMGGKID